MSPPDSRSPSPDALTPIVERNIRALLARRAAEERRRSLQDRLAGAITRFAGSMPFVYLHLVLFGSWIVINLPATPFPKFDPSFVTLAMFASVEAIFLSTFVLITQNRQTAAADQRADLDLQVSLLAEHEITRLVQLVTAIAEKLDVAAARDPHLAALQQDIAPGQVLDQIDASRRQTGSKT